MVSDFSPSCPVPVGRHSHVLLAHGGGGRLMHELLDRVFLSAFSNPALDQGHDETAWSKNRRDEFEIVAGGDKLVSP